MTTEADRPRNEPTSPTVAQHAAAAAARRRRTGPRPSSRLEVGAVPAGAINLNVAGRRLAGPVQGFGQLWQKTYRVRLHGADDDAPVHHPRPGRSTSASSGRRATASTARSRASQPG